MGGCLAISRKGPVSYINTIRHLSCALMWQIRCRRNKDCDDANEVLCRCEIRQVGKTAVGEDARNIFYIVQGNEATTDEYVMQVAQEIIDTTVKYCGGKGHIIIPGII